MDFALPEHLPGLLAEMDAFIEAEIKPLEHEHIHYFDQRREHARTGRGSEPGKLEERSAAQILRHFKFSRISF